MTEEKKKRSRQSHPADETKPTEAVFEGPMNDNDETQIPQEEAEISGAPDLDALTAEMETLRKQCREYQEGWQRERADFINYKKRIERDQVQASQSISANIIKKFLAVQDDMDRAMRNRPAGNENQEWWSGFELITRKLQSILDAEGVKPVAAANDEFDPNRHEAISHEDNDEVESGRIIEVVQQGYAIGDRVIRPAMVRVAR
ncbi:MAG TPA: nucleotide exchange factor GrpE [Bellilinea sp.]|jgi:molecular chaperone GrpE|nr:nucleotide exchange factor GrpE [Bellilinea sp.]